MDKDNDRQGEPPPEAEEGPAPERARRGGTEAAGNVDKIRDIIFGSQMRDYDRRFSRFEERLLMETSDLREEFKRRAATREGYVKGELNAF